MLRISKILPLLKTRAKISGGILLLLFIGYLCGTSMFPHTHLVDGRIVSHSHPYTGTTDNPGHGHSAGQLVTLAQITTAVLAAGLLVPGIVLAARDAEPFIGPGVHFRQRRGDSHISLRGPPAAFGII